MGQTGYGQISRNFKGEMRNPAGKTDSKVINMNTNLIEYVTKTLVKK